MQNKRKATSKASTRKIATAKKAATEPTTVRNTAKVTVKKTVNGVTPAKKTSSGVRRGSRSSHVTTSRFPESLMPEVRTALRPGEKLLVISPSEARTVYVKS